MSIIFITIIINVNLKMMISLGLISLTLSTFSLLFFNHFFIKRKIIDNINKRSSHYNTATRSGGIAIFSSIFIISSINYIMGETIFDYSILVPLGLLSALGGYDDIYSLDFKLKFIFQIIAAKMIIDTGLLIDNFHGVLGIYELNRAFAQVFTIFIIVSIINAINFIDGIDGLAISTFAIFIISFELFSSTLTPYSKFSIMLLASILPLYYFNFRKTNKVFLGDSGSHFLGGVISIYSILILSQNYIIKVEYDLHKIIFLFSILSYPIIDITRIILVRLKNKKSPFEADKNHIHHLIQEKTNSHQFTTLIIISFILILILIFQINNLI